MPSKDPCSRCGNWGCACVLTQFQTITINDEDEDEPEVDFHHGDEDELMAGYIKLQIQADDANVMIEAASMEEIRELLELGIDAVSNLRRNIQ